jgi:hypothetical protein
LQSLFRINYFTIVSHGRFQEIIDEANKSDSIIRKGVEGHFLSSGCIPLRQAARDTKYAKLLRRCPIFAAAANWSPIHGSFAA